MREVDEVTGIIVDAAVKAHQALGPGLLESVYEAVLSHELAERGLKVERQKVVRFEYNGPVLDIPSASPRLRVNQKTGKVGA